MGEAWQRARNHLVGASNKAGVDAGIVAKIAHLESRFNPSAAPIRRDGTRMSSAHGYGQFLDSTWTDMINRHGGKYGVTGAGKLSVAQAGRLRGDKDLQAAMLAEFTRENISKGRKHGGSDDDANAYAFHNLGDGDAKKLLAGMSDGMTVRDALMQGVTTKKGRARVEKVIANNKGLYGDGSVTAATAYGRMGELMRNGEVYAADARLSASINARPNVVPMQTVHVPAAKVPTFTPAPAIAKAPAVADMLGFDSARKPPVMMITNRPEAGQDVADRRIAHIVTGGLGS